jgi:hypothetical protein
MAGEIAVVRLRQQDRKAGMLVRGHGFHRDTLRRPYPFGLSMLAGGASAASPRYPP